MKEYGEEVRCDIDIYKIIKEIPVLNSFYYIFLYTSNGFALIFSLVHIFYCMKNILDIKESKEDRLQIKEYYHSILIGFLCFTATAFILYLFLWYAKNN